MSTIYPGPSFVLDGPKPVPPPFRLIDTVELREIADRHWRNGATIWSYPPDLPHGWNPCSTGTDRVKADGGSIPLPEFGAFVAYLAETCTAAFVVAGSHDNAEIQARYVERATASFLATESFVAEDELMNGTSFPLNPYITDGDLDILDGSGLRADVALGLLEDAIGLTGRAGLVHVTPKVAIALSSNYAVEIYGGSPGSVGAGLWTKRGTRVVVGDGYIGAIPDGQGTILADGTAWMFATGPVQVLRGENVVITTGSIAEAFSISPNTNEITYRVERDYLVDWDTALQAGVLVDVTE